MAMMRYTPATTSSARMMGWAPGPLDPAAMLGALVRTDLVRRNDLANFRIDFGRG